MMSRLLFLLSIFLVTFENMVGLDIITGCLSFSFLLRFPLVLVIFFLWLEAVVEAGAAVLLATAAVFPPELTKLLAVVLAW